MPNNETTEDDHVTITEALTRLASQNRTPARQSFAAAVKSGKIKKAPVRADSKIRVLWSSVQSYVNAGGFRPRQKTASTPEADSDVTTAAALTSKGVSPPPSAQEKNTMNSHVVKGPEKVVSNPHVKPRRERIILKSGRGSNPAPNAHAANTNRDGRDKDTGRRVPNLRTLKNSLRHLTFEETKAIRDWADNRLLNVLRPTLQPTEPESESNINSNSKSK